MSPEKDINACNVEVDFGRLFWEHTCEPQQFTQLAHEVETTLPPSTVRDLTSNLLSTLARSLRAIRDSEAKPGAIICKVRMQFTQPVDPITVNGYLVSLESFLNRAIGSCFAKHTPVTMKHSYERVLVESTTPFSLSGLGVRRPFEA